LGVRRCLKGPVKLMLAAHLSSSAFGADTAWSVPEARNPLSRGARVHGRTMEQRGVAPTTSEWFLIASQGNMVVHIRPGMLLDTDFANPVKVRDTVAIRIALKRHTSPPSPVPTPPRTAARTDVRLQPTFNPLVAAPIGLAAIGLVLLYPDIRGGRVSDSPATARLSSRPFGCRHRLLRTDFPCAALLGSTSHE
jgi:hypothetical protein